MKLFIALVAILFLLAGVAIYVFLPVAELAWMDGPYNDYKKVRTRLNYKALAIDRGLKEYGRAISFPGPEAAMEQALYACRKKAKNCELYAIGNDIVIGKSKQSIDNLIKTYWRKHAARVFSSPWKGRSLSGSEIKPALAGMTTFAITRNGLRTRVVWRFGGALSGDILNNSANPPRQGRGKWWVQGDQLCRQYKNWYSGQKLCGALRLNGDQYLIYSETGDLMVIFKQVGDRAPNP